MKLFRLFLALSFLSLLASACSSTPQASPTSAPATAAASPVMPPTPSPTTSLLSAEMLKNAQYRLPVYEKTVKLANGKYQAGSGPDYIAASLLDQIALGDLNGDGVYDAALLLAENGGGSGTFVSLVVVLNQGGQPVQSVSTLIDDRPKINSLAIQNGKIILDAVIHGANDPMCCPALPVTETYQWNENALTLVRFTSKTPDGAERAITIDQPFSQQQVSSSVQVKGSVTISPFENNLVYQITDQQGNKLSQGPVQVNSKNPGDPGTFDTAIDLSKIKSGQTIRLELSDESAADGSTLAMDSVELVLK